MKKYKLNIILLAFLFSMTLSCNEDILDQTPLDKYSDPTVWSDINLVRPYLSRAYNQIDLMFSRYTMLGCLTDEMTVIWGGASTPYLQGAVTADNLGTNCGNVSWSHYSNIRTINLIIANIDDVPNNYTGSEKASIEAQAKIIKGEALFLRAWEYTFLMRSYGGLPLLSEPFTLDDDFLAITRSTFEETINFIVDDCDEAASLLQLKSVMEMGRATKEAALALKSRVLLFAASDLTADGAYATATNLAGKNVGNLVGYINPDRIALWTAARDAAKDVIDLNTARLSDFGAPDQEKVAEKYHNMFEAHDLSDIEVIWGRMFKLDVGTRHRMNISCGPNGLGCYGSSGLTGQMADSYEMMDGSKFSDHFTINGSNEYINISSTFTDENPYKNREPRFYGSVLYDSAVWQPRFENLAALDPLGIYDRRTRIVKNGGVVVSQRYGSDTRNGPVDTWNGSYSGYLLKKLMDQATIGKFEYNQNIYMQLRFAEVILNYAEACLELGDIPTATDNINLIRNRAGLPDFTGDIQEALRYERKIELFAEDVRWYDIRRWKILVETLNMTPSGIDIIETTEDGVTTTKWIKINSQPTNLPVAKMYWMPIATDELKRAPQLDQNPGY